MKQLLEQAGIDNDKLWFDVESIYETTTVNESLSFAKLWFDVESRYETTFTLAVIVGLAVVV